MTEELAVPSSLQVSHSHVQTSSLAVHATEDLLFAFVSDALSNRRHVHASSLLVLNDDSFRHSTGGSDRPTIDSSGKKYDKCSSQSFSNRMISNVFRNRPLKFAGCESLSTSCHLGRFG